VLNTTLNELTVVIPTYNEEEAIGAVIDELVEVGVPRDRILVVDGYSTDRTREVASSRGVKVILQEGRGKAGALRTAFKYVSTEYFLVMDGDYTYPAKHVHDLLRVASGKGLDEVIGARVYSKGSQSPIYRFGNRVLTKIFNVVFGTSLTDVLSGMYIVRRNALADALFLSRGFSIEAEIAAHIASTTGRVGEVPIGYRRRIGRKKLGVPHGLIIARDIVKLAWSYNPAFMIFIAASLLIIPGLVMGSWVAYNYFFKGIKYYIKGVISIIMTLTGLNSLLLAIMALYMKRMELRIRKMLRGRAGRST